MSWFAHAAATVADDDNYSFINCFVRQIGKKKKKEKIRGKFVWWSEHEPWMHSTLKQMAVKNFFTQSANKVSNMFPCIFRTKLLNIFGKRALGSRSLRSGPGARLCHAEEGAAAHSMKQ